MGTLDLNSAKASIAVDSILFYRMPGLTLKSRGVVDADRGCRL